MSMSSRIKLNPESKLRNKPKRAHISFTHHVKSMHPSICDLYGRTADILSGVSAIHKSPSCLVNASDVFSLYATSLLFIYLNGFLGLASFSINYSTTQYRLGRSNDRPRCLPIKEFFQLSVLVGTRRHITEERKPQLRHCGGLRTRKAMHYFMSHILFRVVEVY